MTDKKDSRPPLESFFKTEFRKWTDEEVLNAVNCIKKDRPNLWKELIKEEIKATSDDVADWLDPSEAIGIIYGFLFKLHPECDLTDIGNLFTSVQNILRSEIAEGLYDGG